MGRNRPSGFLTVAILGSLYADFLEVDVLAAAVFLVLKDGVELALGAEDDFVVAH